MPQHLRPFRRADLDAYTAFWCSPEIAQYMPDRDVSKAAAKVALIDRVFSWELNKPGDCRWYVIADDDTFVGEVMLHWRRTGYGEIAYAVHPDYRGRGIALDAARTMLQIGFEQLHVERLYAACMPFNNRSAHLLERLGMHRDNHPAVVESETDWRGLDIYSISEIEWVRKAA